MNLTQRLIYTGFAAVALASAAMPAFPAPSRSAVLQGPDFEWYASVGRRAEPVVVIPAAREGYIWAPARWEWNGRRHVWVAGRWVVDDYAEQVAIFNHGRGTMVAEAPRREIIILDRR